MRGLLALARREVHRELADPGKLFFDVVWPLMVLAVLGFGVDAFAKPSADLWYLSFLGPGVLGLLWMRRCAAASRYLAVEARRGFREYLVAPVSRAEVLFGWMAGSWLVHSIISLIILTAVIGIVKPSPAGALLAIISVAVSVAATLGISLVLAATVGNLSQHPRMSWLIALVVVGVSGILYPVKALPELLQWISLVSPVTYMVDSIRWSFLGVTHFVPYTGIVVTAIIAFVCASVGMWKSGGLIRV